jgi:hypothetical protein
LDPSCCSIELGYSCLIDQLVPESFWAQEELVLIGSHHAVPILIVFLHPLLDFFAFDAFNFLNLPLQSQQDCPRTYVRVVVRRHSGILVEPFIRRTPDVREARGEGDLEIVALVH